MSIYNRKAAIRNFIIALVLCAALLAGTLFVCINKIQSSNPLFNDDDFAVAIANQLGKKACNVTREDLDKYQSLIYYAEIGVSSDFSSSYVYPVVMLADEYYTEKLLNDELDSEKQDEYKDHYIACIHLITDVDDLLLFRNLRYLSAFDATNVYSMNMGAYYTQLYSSFSKNITPISAADVIGAMALTKLTSFEQLSSLDKLEALAVEYTGIKSLAGVEKLENLKSLDVSGTSVKSLSGIENNTKLDTLIVSGLELEDISPVASLTNLESLDLSSNKIKDISALENLKKLENLSLSSNEIKSIEALKGHEELKNLYLSGNEWFSYLDPIADCVKLETISLSGTKVATLDALEKLTKLTSIDVSNSENKGMLVSIKGVKDLKELTSLNISGNTELKSLEGLEGCEKLLTLTANNCAIEDISLINKLKDITSINLSENNIVEIVEAVKGLNKLTTLNLSKNKITSIAGIEEAFDKDFAATVTLTGNDKLEVLKNKDGEKIDLKKVYEKATFTGVATKDPTASSDTSEDTSAETSK